MRRPGGPPLKWFASTHASCAAAGAHTVDNHKKAPRVRMRVFHGEWALPGGMDPLRLVLGGLLFYLPGLTWTWALTPGLAWAYRAPLSIVAAFTVQPAAMLLLNLILFVPINLTTTVYLSAALTLIGLTILIHQKDTPWDPSRWDEVRTRHRDPYTPQRAKKQGASDASDARDERDA